MRWRGKTCALGMLSIQTFPISLVSKRWNTIESTALSRFKSPTVEISNISKRWNIIESTALSRFKSPHASRFLNLSFLSSLASAQSRPSLHSSSSFHRSLSQKVKTLIELGADVSYFDPEEGLIPLMQAAKQGHSVVIKLLLEAGAPWNALSPSNLSAGDFAMEATHQDAFEMLLNTRIQAELILGTIARKTKKEGNSSGDYLEDRVSFSEDKLMDAESKAVMMAWEKPLMEAHAKDVCSNYTHNR